MNSLSKKAKKGFTLIELLVVIAIIGVLASVVLSSLSDARASAQDAKRKTEMNGVRLSMEMYFTKYNKYPPEDWCDSSKGSNSIGCSTTDPAGDGWNTSSAFYQSFAVDEGFPLPVDPINTGAYFYSFEPSNDGGMGYYFRALLSTGETWGVCGGVLENAYAWCN